MKSERDDPFVLVLTFAVGRKRKGGQREREGREGELSSLKRWTHPEPFARDGMIISMSLSRSTPDLRIVALYSS